MFIKTLIERFGRRNFETHVEETNTFKQTKPLHVMDETIDSKKFQRTMKEDDILHDNLLKVRPSSCILAQGGIQIPFPKEDSIIGGLPNYVEEVEGSNAVIYRVDLAPHVEGGGDLAPTRGILTTFQGSPQDLIHGGPCTISQQHDYAALQLEGEGRKSNIM